MAFLNKTCYELMHGRAPGVTFQGDCLLVLYLKKGRLDKFSWVMLVILEHSVCSTLILT
jgi:hypothetical protein